MAKDLLVKLAVTFIVLAYFFTLAVGLDSPLERYLLLSFALFSIGIYGLISSRNAIRMLMSIEILLNAVNVNLITFSTFVDSLQVKGQIFAIFVMAVAAAEAAVALAIILAVYRNISSVDMNKLTSLKW